MSGLLVCALGSTMLLSGCGGTEITPPSGPSDSSAVRDAAASDLLTSLAGDIAAGDADAAGRLATAQTRAVVRAVVENAQKLRLSDVRFRYVSRASTQTQADGSTSAGSLAPGGSTSDSDGDGDGDGAWDATVTVTWRLPGYDESATTVPARFTFVGEGRDVRLSSTAASGDRGALWLSGPVSVTRTSDTLVVAAQSTKSGSAATLRARAVRAVSDVRKVLPSWRGKLVVEAPASESELERLIGASEGSYAAIAAVTTTVDGSKQPGTPVHVYLNPTVFGGLGPRGSQVVLSHEATHVATRASFATLPTWLLEGFADYVALDHAGIAFTTAAGQVLERVRDNGAPSALPDASDLDPKASNLGATYEEAWTACRFLAQEYGERALVDFYQAVTDGTPVAKAFREVVGTPQGTFVRAWSTDLAAEARGS